MTEPRARELDELQYGLREGPCLAAVTKERFVVVNDLANSDVFPRYGPEASEQAPGRKTARSQAGCRAPRR